MRADVFQTWWNRLSYQFSCHLGPKNISFTVSKLFTLQQHFHDILTLISGSLAQLSAGNRILCETQAAASKRAAQSLCNTFFYCTEADSWTNACKSVYSEQQILQGLFYKKHVCFSCVHGPGCCWSSRCWGHPAPGCAAVPCRYSVNLVIYI